jgi:hypothetical protein
MTQTYNPKARPFPTDIKPDPAAREAQRTSPVAKAEPSPAAQRKAARKRTDPADGEPLPVHSFHTLLGDLRRRRAIPTGRGRRAQIVTGGKL